MSNFGIYIVGFVIVIIGLAVAAYLLGLSTTWIAVGVIILIGFAILTGVSRTRRPDPPGSP